MTSILRIATNDWLDDLNADTVGLMINQDDFRISRFGDTRARTELYCSAEIAECNCPDACERDHGNE